MDTENSYIISPFFVSKVKPFTLIGIPFCEKNENKPKDFIKSFSISQMENTAFQ